MFRRTHSSLAGRGFSSAMTARVLVAAAACLGAAASAGADPIVALTEAAPGLAQRLVSFDSATPGIIGSPVMITGLQKGETILGIDFRPANGALYGLGSTGRLYVIDPVTGVAAARGSAPFAVPLRGTSYGFDFNPTVDRIRITSNEGQNMRAHPDTGAIVDFNTNMPGVQPDGNLAYAAGDVFVGMTPRVVASAYLNSFFGAATTTLFNIDPAQTALVRQAPPNDGVLNTVAMVSLVFIPESASFDIAPRDNAGYITALGSSPDRTGFYSLDLATGVADFIGDIGTAPVSIVGFSVQPSMCPCDFNGDYDLNTQDFFDYMSTFWNTEARANFNRDAVVNSQDFFDYLACFFTEPGACETR